jgi:hypothetical protein
MAYSSGELLLSQGSERKVKKQQKIHSVFWFLQVVHPLLWDSEVTVYAATVSVRPSEHSVGLHAAENLKIALV